jgi:hypothetical protein
MFNNREGFPYTLLVGYYLIKCSRGYSRRLSPKESRKGYPPDTACQVFEILKGREYIGNRNLGG